jgi:hypothetical protein
MHGGCSMRGAQQPLCWDRAASMLSPSLPTAVPDRPLSHRGLPGPNGLPLGRLPSLFSNHQRDGPGGGFSRSRAHD